MNCFICDQELKKEEERFMFPIEYPYMNLFIHKKCWNKEKNTYVEDSSFHQKLLDFISLLPKSSKKR